MIGLEYLLKLYDIQHKDLAEELGIKKQNINAWIKEVRKVPQKYIHILANRFNVKEEYITKELTDEEKFEIQKSKLLNSVISSSDISDSIQKEFKLIDLLQNRNIIESLESHNETVSLFLKLIKSKNVNQQILDRVLKAVAYTYNEGSNEYLDDGFIINSANMIKREEERLKDL